MAYKDYYKILGVEKKAALGDIKKAYHKLAVKFHPDNNKNDKHAEERFKEINEANSVLSDPEKRKRYDEFGENWEHAQHAPPGGGNGQKGPFNRQQTGRQQPFSFDASDFESDERFEDIFSQFFGQRQGRQTTSRNGSDVEADVQITLEDAFNGASHMLSIGKEQHRLSLKKGVREGQQYRLSGKGHPGKNGGKNGDLLVNIRIADHPRYQSTDNDLYCQQSVDLVTAVLGGKTRVQTLHGEKMMTLQPGTQYGATLRMRGLGMPDYNHAGKFGDLYVTISVKIPTKLSQEEQELFVKLAELQQQTTQA